MKFGSWVKPCSAIGSALLTFMFCSIFARLAAMWSTLDIVALEVPALWGCQQWKVNPRARLLTGGAGGGGGSRWLMHKRGMRSCKPRIRKLVSRSRSRSEFYRLVLAIDLFS